MIALLSSLYIEGPSNSFWFCRCMSMPRKGCSMPRFELLNCLLLLENAVEGEVKTERVYCWSDLLVALWCVKSEKKLWKVWVQWRVEEVRKHVGKEVWWYVKTNGNQADIGTSEKSLKLLNENTWRYGGEFSYNNESDWPSQAFIISKVDEIGENSNG